MKHPRVDHIDQKTEPFRDPKETGTGLAAVDDLARWVREEAFTLQSFQPWPELSLPAPRDRPFSKTPRTSSISTAGNQLEMKFLGSTQNLLNRNSRWVLSDLCFNKPSKGF